METENTEVKTTKTKIQIHSVLGGLLFEHECSTIKECVEKANLRGANLGGANLGGADLDFFKTDLIAEILKLPNELEFLKAAIVEGRIDGSTYTGECACLAGTLAHARHFDLNGVKEIPTDCRLLFVLKSSSPRELWFANIRRGDTPKTNQCAKIALDWVEEAIVIRDNIRNTATAE